MKTNITKLFFSIFLITMGFTTAKSQVIIKPNHKTYTYEVRKPIGFNSIHNLSSADVIITQGDKPSVIVKSVRELIPHIITRIKNNTLFIEINTSYRNIDVVEVQITIPDLEKITIEGSGDAIIQNIFFTKSLNIGITGSGDFSGEMDAEKVQIDVRGSGDIDIAGINDELKINVTGSGDINAHKLKLNKCALEVKGSGDVDLEGTTSLLVAKIVGSGDLDASLLKAVKVEASGMGSGDMEVFATDYLKAVCFGSGNIYYRGNPAKMMVSEKGSGEITKR